MLTTLKNALKIKDIRNRILFTFFVLVIVRLGAQLPIPGVSRDVFAQWFEQQTGGAFDFFDALTGGSFTQMSIFALSITPYITSSIIMHRHSKTGGDAEGRRRRKKENPGDYPLCDGWPCFN